MTKVLCFGNTSNGELGFGGIEDDHILLPRKHKLAFTDKRHKLIQLSSGRNHTMMLFHSDANDSSKLLSCGSNVRHQLGRCGSWTRLESITGLNAHFVVTIACGANHTVALTGAGQLFSWGCNLFGQLGLNSNEESIQSPSLIKKLATKFVVQISCGGNHNLALTKEGLIYSWGSNAFGQLGTGIKENFENVPCQIVSLNHVPIRLISSGGSHSLVLSHTGAIYVWGKNDSGQLGLNDIEHRELPTIQNSLRSQRIAYVCCGDEHSAALTQEGGLFTWGAGNYGQLGHGKLTNEILPRRVFELMGSTVMQVSCGRCHTLAAVKSGRVYSFGLNGSGQLGIGTQVNKNVPVIVSGRWTEIGINDLISRNIAGQLLPIVEEVHSPRKTPVESSPKRKVYKADDSPVSTDDDKRSDEMSIDEMNADEMNADDGMIIDSDPINLIVEEPEEFTDEKSANNEKSFVCTSNTIIYNNDSLVINEYETDSDSDFGTDSQKYQLMLKEIVASKGDQSFVLVTRFNDKAEPKDFRTDIKGEILTLNNSIIWTFKSLSKNDAIPEEIFEYIELVFGSIPCLNGSYVDNDVNGPYLPKIDWNAAIHGFYCIGDAENTNINEIITQLITKMIKKLPSFIDDVSDAEILRIYMLLPFLHVFINGYKSHDTITNIIVAFARGFMKLNDNAKEIIYKWWSQMDEHNFKHLITIYKKSVIELLNIQKRHNSAEQTNAVLTIKPILHENLKQCLDFMKILYTFNHKYLKVSYKVFYIEEITDGIDVKFDYVHWYSLQSERNRTQYFFCDYPFVFDPKAKTLVLSADSTIQQCSAAERSQIIAMIPSIMGHVPVVMSDPFLNISVYRHSDETILQQTIRRLCPEKPNEIAHLNYSLKKPLKIEFKDEEAIDAGMGMKKEFFLLIVKDILDPNYALFNEYKDTNIIWFNPCNTEVQELTIYHTIGIICGLAIYNHVIIYLPFPLALYKKILNEPIDIDDLNILDPLLVKNLKEMLNSTCNEEEFNALYSDLNFTISFNCFGSPMEFELENNGKEKLLNWNNRHDYVRLYWDYILNKSVEKQFNAFKEGFNKVVDTGILKLFHAEELMQLVTGQDVYDWYVLEKHGTEYKPPFNPNHPTIIKFWNVFHEFTLEEKKKFLLFLTGSDRIPILGMKALKILIQPMKVGDGHLPVAHTCFNVLDLPLNYRNEEILKQKLKLAIEDTQGFALAVTREIQEIIYQMGCNAADAFENQCFSLS